jgi:hypothetical protein
MERSSIISGMIQLVTSPMTPLIAAPSVVAPLNSSSSTEA